MIFKRGNVRIPLTGEVSDFEGTMLLDKTELEQTNTVKQVKCIIFMIIYLHILQLHHYAQYSHNNKKNFFSFFLNAPCTHYSNNILLDK